MGLVIKDGVSVIVCCYNSAQRLPETLEAIALQRAPELNWEVVVVDNASTDGTAIVAKDTWAGFGAPKPLRVVEEPKAGLNWARRKGIETARYEFLVFCDDDNWLAEDYLSTAANVFDSHEEVAAVGGCGQPAYESSPPPWLEENRLALALGPQNIDSGIVNTLYGAGLCIRASALHRLWANNFSPQLSGRQGEQLSSGEDDEICLALRLSGWKLWYEKTMEFQHFIPTGRFPWSYWKSLLRGQGAGAVSLSGYFMILAPNRIRSIIYRRWYLYLAAVYVRMAGCAVRKAFTSGFPRKPHFQWEWLNGKREELWRIKAESDMRINRILEFSRGLPKKT